MLRATYAPFALRVFLGLTKAIAKVPTTFFRSQLRVDCNERIVEIPFVLQNLASPSGMRILEFGCAESVLSIYLATQGAQVVGADLRDYEFSHPNFSSLKGDFLDNDLPGQSFDAVVAVSALEHSGLGVYAGRRYNDGDLKVIREFARILKPNGLLLLTVPFGDRYIDDQLRVYDPQQLAELTQGFSVLRRQFYRKATDGTHWIAARAEECSLAGYDPITGVQGVALLLCEKDTSAIGNANNR